MVMPSQTVLEPIIVVSGGRCRLKSKLFSRISRGNAPALEDEACRRKASIGLLGGAGVGRSRAGNAVQARAAIVAAANNVRGGWSFTVDWCGLVVAGKTAEVARMALLDRTFALCCTTKMHRQSHSQAIRGRC